MFTHSEAVSHIVGGSWPVIHRNGSLTVLVGDTFDFSHDGQDNITGMTQSRGGQTLATYTVEGTQFYQDGPDILGIGFSSGAVFLYFNFNFASSVIDNAIFVVKQYTNGDLFGSFIDLLNGPGIKGDGDNAGGGPRDSN